MPLEANRRSTGYASLTDATGDPITVAETVAEPRVNPKAPLITRDRHVSARSTGERVVRASSGRDLCACGGTRALTTAGTSLIRHRPGLIVTDPTRTFPGDDETGRYNTSLWV
jgi:hypothetical protein